MHLYADRLIVTVFCYILSVIGIVSLCMDCLSGVDWVFAVTVYPIVVGLYGTI